MLILNQFTPRLVARLGEQVVGVSGLALLACGMLWMAQLGAASTFLTGILAPAIVLGLGAGLTFAPITSIVMAQAPADETGQASSLLQGMQQLGGSIGVAGLTTVFAAVTVSERRGARHRRGAARRHGVPHGRARAVRDLGTARAGRCFDGCRGRGSRARRRARAGAGARAGRLTPDASLTRARSARQRRRRAPERRPRMQRARPRAIRSPGGRTRRRRSRRCTGGRAGRRPRGRRADRWARARGIRSPKR